ncbi:hypothetical protein, partial [Roseivirga seohaensis]|uniref:hypothetical protein n=1 Tax=Roseivirga seohaensis TaxID=1914963 RepID=UPI001C87B377
LAQKLWLRVTVISNRVLEANPTSSKFLFSSGKESSKVSLSVNTQTIDQGVREEWRYEYHKAGTKKPP